MKESSQVDMFSVENGFILINLDGLAVVTKTGEVYRGLHVMCKLLSLEQIVRIDTLDTSSPVTKDVLELAIIKNTIVDYLGIEGEEVDYDRSDAGLVSRISNSVILKSIEVAKDPVKFIRIAEEDVSALDSLAAIVSRYMNIPFDQVTRLPINTMIRYFAICKSSFPSEVKLGNEEEHLG